VVGDGKSDGHIQESGRSPETALGSDLLCVFLRDFQFESEHGSLKGSITSFTNNESVLQLK